MLGPVRAAIRGTELTLKLLGKMASLDLELFQRQLGVELSAVRCPEGPEGFDRDLLCSVSKEDMIHITQMVGIL